MALQAFFLPSDPGMRFCLLHTPPVTQAVRGGVVYVHPFAEELNCSRRVAALQARDFAALGYVVLQMDLFGCGDSSGTFEEATWSHWRADVQMAIDYLAARVDTTLWLWGLRSGCLLMVEAAAQQSVNLLFWQPVLSGTQILRHFLRLQLAGEVLSGSGHSSINVLRQRFDAGETLEIAGYRLTPTLAAELAVVDWQGAGPCRRIECFEIHGSEASELSPGLAASLAHWRAIGHTARARAVTDTIFWQTPGLDAPNLRQASCTALLG